MKIHSLAYFGENNGTNLLRFLNRFSHTAVQALWMPQLGPGHTRQHFASNYAIFENAEC